MAPKTAVPNEPPIMRKNTELLVATPEVLVGHRVLHGDHEHLHDQPHADAEDEHVAGQDPAVRRRIDHRQQVRADGHQCGADHRKDLVAAPAGHESSGDDRSAEHAEHQRQNAQSRRRGTDALDDLHVERQEGERAEHGEAHDEADGAGRVEDPLPEQLQWDHRLRGVALGEEERHRQHDAEDRGENARYRQPGPRDAAQAGEDDQ